MKVGDLVVVLRGYHEGSVGEIVRECEGDEEGRFRVAFSDGAVLNYWTNELKVVRYGGDGL